MKCRLGILLSGRGSNFAAILEAIERGDLPGAEIALVFSNHTDAAGLDLARGKGLKTLSLEKTDFENRRAFDQALTEALQESEVDLVVLAGYDRILTSPLLEAYPHRILNIHPSLLPHYGGKGMLGIKVHEAVLANGELESGCSVHLVTDVVDGGEVLGQGRVRIRPDDTPETLAARILKEEHRLYPQMIGRWIEQHFSQQGVSHAQQV